MKKLESLKKLHLVFGMFSLVLGISFARQFTSMPATDFLSGMFFGLSFVFNISFILHIRKTQTA